MKVRVIQKPQYEALCHLQVKYWWWPFWVTVTANSRQHCERVAENMLRSGHIYTVFTQGERK